MGEKYVVIFDEAEDKTLGKSAFAIDFAKRIEKYFKEHPDKIINGGKINGRNTN